MTYESCGINIMPNSSHMTFRPRLKRWRCSSYIGLSLFLIIFSERDFVIREFCDKTSWNNVTKLSKKLVWYVTLTLFKMMLWICYRFKTPLMMGRLQSVLKRQQIHRTTLNRVEVTYQTSWLIIFFFGNFVTLFHDVLSQNSNFL